jgi:hypothetical protein
VDAWAKPQASERREVTASGMVMRIGGFIEVLLVLD